HALAADVALRARRRRAPRAPRAQPDASRSRAGDRAGALPRVRLPLRAPLARDASQPLSALSQRAHRSGALRAAWQGRLTPGAAGGRAAAASRLAKICIGELQLADRR